MTWTTVGALNPNGASGTSSFSLTPAGVGHLIVVGIINNDNATVYATALSSSNVTWTPVTHVLGTGSVNTGNLFIGQVTAASAATVTITWSGTAPNSYITGQEYASSVGSWALGPFTVLNSAGTNTWSSLTANAGDLYVGYCNDSGAAVAGTTPGFTWGIDGHSNGFGYRLSCASGANAPVWGDSGHTVGCMTIVQESGGAPPKIPQQVHIYSPVTRLSRRKSSALYGR